MLEQIILYIGVIAVGINAFFLKAIYSQLNAMNIKMAKISSDSDHATLERTRIDKEISTIRERNHTLSNNIQAVYGKISMLEKIVKREKE